MLTKGQANYLAKIPNDKKMVVKPFNPKGLEIANQVIAEIRAVEPDLEIILLGSLPLKILGQEDIDISVFCIKSEQPKHLDNFKKLFGEPNRTSKNSVGWDFQRDGFFVSVWLTDPTTETTKAQVEVFNLLKSNPDLLKEYEKIKEEAKDLSYKEYQRRKYEFYNRILGIKIKVIIFDLNGVFIQGPKLSDRFQKKFGVPSGKFISALKDIMPKIRMPNAGDSFSYWKSYLDEWGLNLTKEEFFDFWFSGEKEVPEMIDLAKELKNQGIKIFILSNNFIERATYYDQNFPFLKEIAEKIYYSWQTGFVKPNPEAYKLILSENNLKPNECIYFDDSEENIGVANNLGINSFLFTDIERAKHILGEVL